MEDIGEKKGAKLIFRQHKGRFSCQLISALLQQGERTAQLLREAQTSAPLCTLSAAAAHRQLCMRLDGDQHHLGWVTGQPLPLVICSHNTSWTSPSPAETNAPSPLSKPLLFLHPWKYFKAGVTSPFHIAVLSLLSGAKMCVDIQHLRVQIWQGEGQGEKYIWRVQGAIKAHCCGRRGQAVTALHMGPTSTPYTLH